MGDFSLLHVASLNLWNKDSFKSSLISLNSQADCVWPLLIRKEDTDVTAVGVVFRNTVLTMQETIESGTFTIRMEQYRVLGQSNGMWQLLVINTPSLHEHPKVEILATLSHPRTL